MKNLHPVTEDLILSLVLMAIIIATLILLFLTHSLGFTAIMGIAGFIFFAQFRKWFLSR